MRVLVVVLEASILRLLENTLLLARTLRGGWMEGGRGTYRKRGKWVRESTTRRAIIPTGHKLEHGCSYGTRTPCTRPICLRQETSKAGMHCSHAKTRRYHL